MSGTATAKSSGPARPTATVKAAPAAGKAPATEGKRRATNAAQGRGHEALPGGNGENRTDPAGEVEVEIIGVDALVLDSEVVVEDDVVEVVVDDDDDDDVVAVVVEDDVAPVAKASVARPAPGRPPSAKEEPPPPFNIGERIILIQNTRPRTGTPIGDHPVGAQGRVETVLSQTAIIRFDRAADTKEVVAFTCLDSLDEDAKAQRIKDAKVREAAEKAAAKAAGKSGDA